MFSLRIHSLDINHPVIISNREEEGTITADSTSRNPKPNIQERRGIIHLYRKICSPNPSTQQTTLLFVLAVPSRMSYKDFLSFCGSCIDLVSEILIIRNDFLEDRYSVLIKFFEQRRAHIFYQNFNGKLFSSTKAEVCHIFFTASVEYTEVPDIFGIPPPGFTELPTCPICLEKLNQDTSGILTTVFDRYFQCSCISKRTNSSCQICRFCQQQTKEITCSVCETSESLYICVICGFVGCGRYEKGHAMDHWKVTQHSYTRDLETQRIWDYVGNTFVHRFNQSKDNGKFVELNSNCRSFDGKFEMQERSEESGITRPNHSSKFDMAKEKREKSISKAVEKAVNAKLQEIQLKIEKCIEENKVVANQQHSKKPICSACGTSESLYMCVICGFVGCGRYQRGHAMRHWKDTGHSYTRCLETKAVWDYVGDTYAHLLNQSKTDGKFVEACQFCQHQAKKSRCSVCGTSEDLWICETCGFVGCGRYNNGHAMRHWKDTGHSYTRDLETRDVWDYVGHTYVLKSSRSNTDTKFVELNSQYRSYDGDSETSECSKEFGFSGAFHSSKLKGAEGEREKSISEAVEKAVNSKLREIRLMIKKCVEEN